MIGEGAKGSLWVNKVTPTFQSYTSTSTDESSCKAHESAHSNIPSFQTPMQGFHVINFKGYFINIKNPFTLTAASQAQPVKCRQDSSGKRVDSTFDNE